MSGLFVVAIQASGCRGKLKYSVQVDTRSCYLSVYQCLTTKLTWCSNIHRIISGQQHRVRAGEPTIRQRIHPRHHRTMAVQPSQALGRSTLVTLIYTWSW